MTTLFGSSGIRGLVNEKITPALALQAGQALATIVKAQTVLTAHDTRTSSPMLQDALAAGAMACGATVLCQGMIPTPVLAFLTKNLGADAGAMITASHNPPEYNGIKLFNSNSTSLNEKQQNQMEELIRNRKHRFASWDAIGKITRVDETRQYVDRIVGDIRVEKNWKIVLDPGNGSTSQLAPEIFRKSNCKVTTINSHPDGHFPGRGSELTHESLQPLCKAVRGLKADLGVAFDGDGDRMIVVDEKGRIADSDRLLAAYAAHAIGRHENKKVVTNVEASMCIETMVGKEGGEVIRTKVGDVYIADAIRRNRASFGAEPCGAWIHPKYHYCPDGILSSTLLLSALEEESALLSEFISGVPESHMLRRNIDCSDSEKESVMNNIHEKVRSGFIEIKEESRIDGLRLTLKEGWLLIRPSGTEPLIRITVETQTEREATDILNAAATILRKEVKAVSR